MKVATLPHRHRHLDSIIPDGMFWDDELGNIMIDEDGTLIELI